MTKLYDNKAEDFAFNCISELCISSNKMVPLETCWLEYNEIFELLREFHFHHQILSVKKERFNLIYNDVVNTIKKWLTN